MCNLCPQNTFPHSDVQFSSRLLDLCKRAGFNVYVLLGSKLQNVCHISHVLLTTQFMTVHLSRLCVLACL